MIKIAILVIMSKVFYLRIKTVVTENYAKGDHHCIVHVTDVQLKDVQLYVLIK
jgi:hypothetical protein